MNGGVIYTVLGLLEDQSVWVAWDGSSFAGSPLALQTIERLRRDRMVGGLGAALTLIGRALDRVDQIRVDDGEQPWQFDAASPGPASTSRRRQILRSTSMPSSIA